MRVFQFPIILRRFLDFLKAFIVHLYKHVLNFVWPQEESESDYMTRIETT